MRGRTGNSESVLVEVVSDSSDKRERKVVVSPSIVGKCSIRGADHMTTLCDRIETTVDSSVTDILPTAQRWSVHNQTNRLSFFASMSAASCFAVLSLTLLLLVDLGVALRQPCRPPGQQSRRPQWHMPEYCFCDGLPVNVANVACSREDGISLELSPRPRRGVP